jgi:DNA (cytosine-5)-methyltransferase 1
VTVGSLFAGIGGFDLGFERAGYEIRWQVEIDPWARRVLEKHWPHVHRHDDIRTAGAHILETVDVLCGGFPCTDISLAGKGAGITGPQSGLWSEYARLIRELRPRYVVVENVAALLTRGLGRVLGELAACGYDAEWDCIPAAAVGAPHRRDRLWLVAYADGAVRGDEQISQRGRSRSSNARDDGAAWHVADADRGRRLRGGLAESARQQGARGREPDGRGGVRQQFDATTHDADSIGIGLEGVIFSGAVSRATHRSSLRRDSGWWETEPDVGRVADGLPGRVDRLRGLGNAIVPQIAEWIAERIIEAESLRVTA